MSKDEQSRCIVWGDPIAFARPAGSGRRYTPRRYGEWKSMAVEYMRFVSKVPRLGESPVLVTVAVHPNAVDIRITTANNGVGLAVVKLVKAERPKGVRGDVDNYLKAALDAAQDAQWIDDDRQVIAAAAWFDASKLEREDE